MSRNFRPQPTAAHLAARWATNINGKRFHVLRSRMNLHQDRWPNNSVNRSACSVRIHVKALGLPRWEGARLLQT